MRLSFSISSDQVVSRCACRGCCYTLCIIVVVDGGASALNEPAKTIWLLSKLHTLTLLYRHLNWFELIECVFALVKTPNLFRKKKFAVCVHAYVLAWNVKFKAKCTRQREKDSDLLLALYVPMFMENYVRTLQKCTLCVRCSMQLRHNQSILNIV